MSAEEQIRAARESDTAQIRPKSESGPHTHHRFGSTKRSPESDSNRRPLPYHGGRGLAAVLWLFVHFAPERQFLGLGRDSRLRLLPGLVLPRRCPNGRPRRRLFWAGVLLGRPPLRHGLDLRVCLWVRACSSGARTGRCD